MDLFWLAFKTTSRMRAFEVLGYWETPHLWRETKKKPWAKIGPKFGICCCFFTLFWNGCRQHMSFMSVYVSGGWTLLMFFLVLIFHDGGDPKQPLHGLCQTTFSFGPKWWESSRGAGLAEDFGRSLHGPRSAETSWTCTPPWRTLWMCNF